MILNIYSKCNVYVNRNDIDEFLEMVATPSEDPYTGYIYDDGSECYNFYEQLETYVWQTHFEEYLASGLVNICKKYDDNIKLNYAEADNWDLNENNELLMQNVEFNTNIEISDLDDAEKYRLEQDIYTYFDTHKDWGSKEISIECESKVYSEGSLADYFDMDAEIFGTIDWLDIKVQFK